MVSANAIPTEQERDAVQAFAVKTVHDAMVGEGWLSIGVETARDSVPHLVMRYRNQLGLVAVETKWSGTEVAGLDVPRVTRLVAKAEALRAIPLRSRLAIEGALPAGRGTFRALSRSGALTVMLPDGCLLEDLAYGSPWDAARYDLDEPIEMSEWELHDLGVQAVRDHLEAQGYEIVACSSEGEADPQIVARQDGRATFVLVRTMRHPSRVVRFDRAGLSALAAEAADKGAEVRLATVAFAGEDSPSIHDTPLYRGAPLRARIGRLQEILPGRALLH